MKKSSRGYVKKLVIGSVVLSICLIYIFSYAIGGSIVTPIVKNAVRIHDRVVDNKVDLGVYTWITAENGSWKLIINKATNTFAMNGFYGLTSLKADGQLDYGVYYFDQFGTMIVGWAKDDSGYYYYFDVMRDSNYGRMCSGWRKISNSWFYFDGNGRMLVNQVTPDGFMVGIDGSMVINNATVDTSSNKVGSIITNKGTNAEINVGEEPPMLQNAVRIHSRVVDKPAEFGKYNWVLKESGRWSLNLDIANQYLFASDGFYGVPSIKADGQLDYGIYYFDQVGSMVIGWAKDEFDNYYYFDADKGGSYGRMCSGWRKIGTGWFYFDETGKMLVQNTTPDGYNVGIDGSIVSGDNSTSRYSKKYSLTGILNK